MNEMLNKLRALCDAAMPGPWKYRRRKYLGPNVCITTQTGANLYLFAGADCCEWGEETAQFIAAARTAIPLLLDVVEAQDRFLIATADWMESNSETDIAMMRIALDAMREAKAKLEAVCL